MLSHQFKLAEDCEDSQECWEQTQQSTGSARRRCTCLGCLSVWLTVCPSPGSWGSELVSLFSAWVGVRTDSRSQHISYSFVSDFSTGITRVTLTGSRLTDVTETAAPELEGKVKTTHR